MTASPCKLGVGVAAASLVLMMTIHGWSLAEAEVLPADAAPHDALFDCLTTPDCDEGHYRELVDRIHYDCYAKTPFPSAATCQKCHPGHYKEWSVSPHAYAQLSPVFNAMHAELVKRTSGTNGDFCIRCHTPIGIANDEPLFASNLERDPVSTEGVTCAVCHRINQAWGKQSGRQSLLPGDIHGPVTGPRGAEELRRVFANTDEFGPLKTINDPDLKARDIHSDAIPLWQFDKSGFCGTCHDVYFHNGFRLEDAFSEYKRSPAARQGISCNDCHMSTVPGVNSGYACEPAAIIGNAQTKPRKRTNHMFIGPDYSIVHPGLFPHNPKVQKSYVTPEGLATLGEWLTFEHEAGWGVPEVENELERCCPNLCFPPAWKDRKKREKARRLLNEQEALLEFANQQRLTILRNGYQLGDVKARRDPFGRLRFKVEVKNATSGHGVPTGFDAERLVWLQVDVTDGCGNVIYQSGDLDPNGDVRDLHSLYVHDGLLPLDRNLFSLQTRFVTRNIRGSEREQVLAVNYSIDPLPYIRPEIRSHFVLGRPLGARKHKQNIPPCDSRWADYPLPKKSLKGTTGPYHAHVRLIAGMVPVNLVHEIASVGFDYGLSEKEVAERVVDGHQVLWEKSIRIEP